MIIGFLIGWFFLKDPMICASGMGEFRFECYYNYNDKTIQKDLRKLHPVGSDLDKFKVTMNQAGAIFLGSGIEKDYYYEGYDFPDGILNWEGWTVDVFADLDKKKIKKIRAYNRYQGI